MAQAIHRKIWVISPEYSISNDHDLVILSSFVSEDGPSQVIVLLRIIPPLRPINYLLDVFCALHLIDDHDESQNNRILFRIQMVVLLSQLQRSCPEDISKPAKDVLSTIVTAEELGLIPAEQQFDQRFPVAVGMDHSMRPRLLFRHLPRA